MLVLTSIMISDLVERDVWENEEAIEQAIKPSVEKALKYLLLGILANSTFVRLPDLGLDSGRRNNKGKIFMQNLHQLFLSQE